MYAEVIIEYPVKKLDRTFTYIVPTNLNVKKGMKVVVPFGAKKVNGFVLNVTNKYSGDYELKEIINLTSPEIVLTDELLEMGKYMSKTTLSTLISSYQTMFPSSLKVKDIKTNYNIYDLYYNLNKSEDGIKEYILNNKRNTREIYILNILLKEKRVIKEKINYSSLKTLLDKGLIKEERVQKYRIEDKSKKQDNIKLTKEQVEVVNKINLNKNDTYLLWGVTGSGKTEVYINLIEKVIKNNNTAIMLVPEISLTMQIVNRFYNKFGSKVAVFHSALSVGEKHDEYLKIIRGEVKVVVGTRSAIFVPLQNLGIIIIDEEHSSSYKQDNNPRYHARDMALFRTEYNNIPLLLGSATPTMESMTRGLTNNYKLLTLKNRVLNSKLPEVIIVDMIDEIKKRNSILSSTLKYELISTLEKGEQAIILLNRRGHSTYINCSNCGYTYKCPSCDISLTYHKSTNNLICHYCSYKTKKDDKCPSCGEESLNYLGLGTEKLEKHLMSVIPNANIVRMDQDTTTRKGSHDKIIKDFKEGKHNILLGTQMISKGLDFPNVTLVGVVNADNSLNIPDYKSNENTFSLLNQTSGRAGRREKMGKVIIQTFNKDHNVFNYIKNNDYLSFFKEELSFRKKLKYPPYYYLVSIKVISKDYHKSLSNAEAVVKHLKRHLANDSIVLGPTTAMLFKLNNLYRFQIIIKYKKDSKLLEVLKYLDSEYDKKDVYLEIDINPNMI